jgi:hypothetical protein
MILKTCYASCCVVYFYNADVVPNDRRIGSCILITIRKFRFRMKKVFKESGECI